MNVSVTPIISSRERRLKEEVPQKERSIPSKVVELVLDRINQAKGGLLPSAMAPQIVIDLLPSVESAKAAQISRSKQKWKLRKMPLAKRMPIGLHPADMEGWVNALMQFISFVPGFAELFLFAPRSYQSFQEFIDQYHQDQQDNRAVSSADGRPIRRFFKDRFSDSGFLEIFRFLIGIIHPKWEVDEILESALEKGHPLDLFVERSLKKQQWVQSDLCYDLDAFIELRPDIHTASYIAYVKVEGGWYQCDNERVTRLRSDSLASPLHRAILLHYRRMHLTKSGWL